MPGWVSKNQQYSLCTGEREGLGFLICISFRSPLKVKSVDEVTVVKKEMQRVRRERSARQLPGVGGRPCRECGVASILATPAGTGTAEPGFQCSGCWGAGLPGSSSWQPGERHQGLPEPGLTLVLGSCWSLTGS